MIEIPQPSMALNSHSVPGPKYKMQKTYDVPANHSPEAILANCVRAGGEVSGGLKVLIINCHGKYSNSSSSGTGGFGLTIGTGIRRADTGKISVLRGIVNNIWITACGTARISIPGTSGDGDGNLFCSEIAKASGAYVVAATTAQYGDENIPDNHIDNWEGLVLRYNPSGGVDWSHDYGRNFLDGLLDGGWN